MTVLFPSRRNRRLLGGPLGLGLCLIASGCAVEHSSLSIDSNSRSPFLGLQFMQPKEKEPAYHRPIARSKKGPEAKVALATEPAKTESKWSDWLNPLPQRVSQPLPRTEPAEQASVLADQSASEELIEF